MILHADADAFFASVELRDRPDLEGVPMAVAIHVVVSATYPARAYGVTGGMPVAEAVRRCPELVVVPPRFDGYTAAGEQLLALFGRFARRVEPGSMEEAFLDVGDRDPIATAGELRTAARAELGLPVSVGVARTRLLAKLASRRAKPDGMVVVDAATEGRIRAGLTVAETWGIGPRTAERLAHHDVVAIPQLAGWDETRLAGVVGVAMARRLLAIRDGTDDDEVHLLAPRRTISASRSTRPRTDPDEIGEHLARVTRAALDRLLATPAPAHRVEVTVRLRDGTTRTERTVLPTATRDEPTLSEAARVLLRLTGVLTPDRSGPAVTLIAVGFGLAGVAPSREQEALPLF